MGVKSIVTYKGNLMCNVRHSESGTVIETEAPKDNGGNGTRFSPTDLVASALGTCMMTMIGFVAEREGLNMEGTTVEVEKEMAAEPARHIAKFNINVTYPEGLNLTDAQRKKLAGAAKACPVKASLNPEIEFNINFN